MDKDPVKSAARLRKRIEPPRDNKKTAPTVGQSRLVSDGLREETATIGAYQS